jgi:8-oxo-dGTP diphosphatase
MTKQRHRIIPASYLVLCKDEKVLLVRRFNTGYGDGNYSMIAGHVEPGESFTQCILREAKEEAGIDIKPENLHVAHIMQRYSKDDENNERIDIYFIAKDWTGELSNKEPDKCDDFSWFGRDNLPKNILPYINDALIHIKNKIHYSEIQE